MRYNIWDWIWLCVAKYRQSEGIVNIVVKSIAYLQREEAALAFGWCLMDGTAQSSGIWGSKTAMDCHI